MPVSAGVGQEHSDLAVLHPPRGTGVLTLHPGRAHPLLQETGVAQDQHCFRVAEMLDHVAAYVVADPVDVPVGDAQQPLHPIRGHRPRVLGQCPAVLAFQPGQQALHIGADPLPRLGPPEPARDPAHQRIQHANPPTKIQHAAIIAGSRLQPPTTRPSAVAVLGLS